MNKEDHMSKNIDSLFDKVEEIIESPRNNFNKIFWDTKCEWPRDMWRGFPVLQPNEGIPYLIFPDNGGWAKLLGVDLQSFYSDPVCHLETQLLMTEYHFNHLPDNMWFNRDLFIWFGVITELSFFGPKIVFFSNREGWIETPYLLEKKETLNSLSVPNFFTSGLMPRIHKFYEVMSSFAQKRGFRVLFPQWVRGPFCIAAHLRGIENIIMDMLEDPGFVHQLMSFIVHSEKEWAKERAKFLGEPIHSTFFFNDEVGLPLITPEMYKEFVLPYELDLAAFYGGITYWHSCGDTTQFISDINTIPGIKMLHVGPFTDIHTAFETKSNSIALDINLHPVRDVLEADRLTMSNTIKNIVQEAQKFHSPTCIRADGLQAISSIEDALAKFSLWNDTARSLLPGQS